LSADLLRFLLAHLDFLLLRHATPREQSGGG
jgi:hypothetical protein